MRDVAWRRGAGYDVDGLTKLYTGSDVRAQQVVKEFADRVDDLSTVRCLGFCVSVQHAAFMARVFNDAGIPACDIVAATSDQDRRAAIHALADGELRVLFSVDLFNEGLDVPSVDTLLMLRPTESPTLFLQQLGRGLRKEAGKSVCTVLDFVGQHRREFRFDRRLRALLGGTRRDVEHQVEQGFPYLPAGCHMELDRKASEIVLASIRSAIPDRWPQKVDELRALVAGGHPPTLAALLAHSGMDVDDVYAGNRGWSDLCEAARLPTAPPGPQERVLRRGVARLLHVDDPVRLRWYRTVLAGPGPDIAAMTDRERRLTRMLVAQLVDQVPTEVLAKSAALQEGLELVWQHPQVCAEAVELLEVLEGLVDHVHFDLPGRSDVPLRVHARYSRLEILAAFGWGAGARVVPWQTGVMWRPEARADLFAITLDKSTGSSSPTTRYRDYAISPDLFHWESQATTRATSDTGQRYQHHASRGSAVFLFARLRQSDRDFWWLGPATYVSHEGERPMAITWRLRYPLPGDLFAGFAAAVA